MYNAPSASSCPERLERVPRRGAQSFHAPAARPFPVEAQAARRQRYGFLAPARRTCGSCPVVTSSNGDCRSADAPLGPEPGPEVFGGTNPPIRGACDREGPQQSRHGGLAKYMSTRGRTTPPASRPAGWAPAGRVPALLVRPLPFRYDARRANWCRRAARASVGAQRHPRRGDALPILFSEGVARAHSLNEFVALTAHRPRQHVRPAPAGRAPSRSAPTRTSRSGTPTAQGDNSARPCCTRLGLRALEA